MMETWFFYSFLVYMAAHLMFWRKARLGFSHLAMLAFLVLLVFLALGPLKSAEELTGFSGYFLFFSMLYWHWYVGVDRSVSIRILNELRAQPAGLSLEDIDKIYSAESMFEHRLQLMAKNGWLRENGARYSLTPKADRLARWTNLLRRVYNIRQAG